MAWEIFLHGFLGPGKCLDMVSSGSHEKKLGPVGPAHISQIFLLFDMGCEFFTWFPKVWKMF
jgi:hypothetical protein